MELKQKLAMMKVMSDRNCPNCFGRGYDGVTTDGDKAIICKCVRRKARRATDIDAKMYESLATLEMI